MRFLVQARGSLVICNIVYIWTKRFSKINVIQRNNYKDNTLKYSFFLNLIKMLTWLHSFVKSFKTKGHNFHIVYIGNTSLMHCMKELNTLFLTPPQKKKHGVLIKRFLLSIERKLLWIIYCIKIKIIALNRTKVKTLNNSVLDA